MGIGGDLMWTALAREIYNKHKKPVLFIGKKGGVLQNAIYKNNPHITFDRNSDHIKINLKFRCLPERTSKKIGDYLEENSKKEREAVADALHDLSLKMNTLKEADYYKEMQEKLEKYEEKLEITMTKVFIAYKKGIKMIFRQYPSNEERKQKGE